MLIRFVSFASYSVNNKKNESDFSENILLIPPSYFDGSFGDELMSIVFLEKFKNYPITILVEKHNQRADLFDGYSNLKFVRWGKFPNINSYNGGIYILGADNMTDSYGVMEPLFKIDVLRFGNRAGISTKILGFSFRDKVNPLLLNGFRSVIKKTKLKLRESDSFERIKRILPSDNIELVADLAFLCPLKYEASESYRNWLSNSDDLIVGVCPNAIQAAKVGADVYVNQLCNLLFKAWDKHKIRISLLYHDLRPQCIYGSDRELSNLIYSRLKEMGVDCYYNPDILNGVELKAYLKDVDFTLTGRMHFGISGLSLCKPMFGIAYESKFSGLQKLFEIDPDQSLIDYKKLDEAFSLFDDFIYNLALNTKKVQSNLGKVIEMSNRNFD